MWIMLVPHREQSVDIRCLLRGSFYFLYIDDIRTSQETYLYTSTACYGDSFTFHMWIMLVPHREHIYKHSLSVIEFFIFYK
jgi:hypothetical protein